MKGNTLESSPQIIPTAFAHFMPQKGKGKGKKMNDHLIKIKEDREDVHRETNERLCLWKEYIKRKGAWCWGDELAYVYLKKLLSKEGGEEE